MGYLTGARWYVMPFGPLQNIQPLLLSLHTLSVYFFVQIPDCPPLFPQQLVSTFRMSLCPIAHLPHLLTMLTQPAQGCGTIVLVVETATGLLAPNFFTLCTLRNCVSVHCVGLGSGGNSRGGNNKEDTGPLEDHLGYNVPSKALKFMHIMFILLFYYLYIHINMSK